MKKIIVAGSRSFNDYNLLKETLNTLFSEPVIVVSGCAAGADTMGEQWAHEKGYDVEKHPADWKNVYMVPGYLIKYNKYGVAYNVMAGHNRNKKMLESVKNNPDGGCVVAFWDGNSNCTENMIRISQKAGIDVHIIHI